jgi:hypothetical protein
MSVTAVPLQPVKSSYKMWLWFGLVLAVALAFALAWWGTGESRAKHLPVDQDAKFLAWHKTQPGVTTTASGLQYTLLKPGMGPTAKDGDGVLLSTEGRFRDGTIFQNKFADQLLVGDANPQFKRIPGYAEGVKLMNKGSVYRFWIPANLAYGENPPDPRMRKNAMMIFDIEMTEHLSAEEIKELQEQQMRQMLQQQQAAPPEGGEGAEGSGGAPKGEAPKQ